MGASVVEGKEGYWAWEPGVVVLSEGALEPGSEWCEDGSDCCEVSFFFLLL